MATVRAYAHRMARGHNHPLRSTLAGHAPQRSRTLAYDDDDCRAAAMERMWAFIAEYYDPLTAESERFWVESRGDVAARQEALVRRAEDLSRILGYPYGSYSGTQRRAHCAGCAAPLLPSLSETGYGPDQALFHRACMPPRAGHDYGFVRWDDDPEAFFIRAFAELDAGIARPGAIPPPGARP